MDQNIKDLSNAIDPQIWSEIIKSEDLFEKGFYTEATVRLGRCIERCLYGTGIELGLDIKNREISCLSGLNHTLRDVEIQVIKHRNIEHVRKLANISKRLCEAILELVQNPDCREGRLNEYPRRNEQLFREILLLVDESTKRRLESQRELLREIQTLRNLAAHASAEGEMNEISQQSYLNFEQNVSALLETLLNFRIGLFAEASSKTS